MTTKTQGEEKAPETAVTSETAQDAAQWTTVSEEDVDEIKVVFEEIGDEFIGVYLGPRKVENEDGGFTQHRFAIGQEHYFINGNHSLNQSMVKVVKGMLCRVVWTSERETGAPSPMRVYRVDIDKSKRAKRR